MEKLPTIFADFNNLDIEKRARLTTNGAKDDIKAQNIKLSPGLRVLLNDREELSIIGIVEFSDRENIWVARFDWDTLNNLV